MLTKEQIDEIREHLENAKNPVFFFDNDPDGLCSFLLLQRFIGRGRGVPIKSFPGLNKSYFRKVEEFKADYVFILDKPVVDKDFIEEVSKKHLPIVWIDHHDVGNAPEGFRISNHPENLEKKQEDFHDIGETGKPNVENYYNTFITSGKNEPVSYLCYKITNRKEDEWIAAVGCVADYFIPEFLEDFKKKNPDLVAFKYKNAFDIVYNTRLGEIMKIMSFGLKDSVSNVTAMLKFLMNAKSPSDIFEENARTKTFLKRTSYINERYSKILEKAKESIDEKNNLLFFTYSGELSISQDVSNELMYRNPEMVIAVGFIRGNEAKFSLRGAPIDVREVTLNAIKDIDGARGGGHKHSTGAQMKTEDVSRFRENILREMRKVNKKEENN